MTTGSPIASARVLVCGDVMLDRYWFGEVERISPEAPVPVVRIDRSDERLGGAANVARNVSALGAKAGLLGIVGEDEAGRSVGNLLIAASVTSHIRANPALTTTVKVRVIGRGQQMLRVDFDDRPQGELLLQYLDGYRSLLSDYDLVVLSDYGKGGLTHIARMIEMARQAGKAILVDPKGEDYSRYMGATIVTPNRAELRDVVGRWKDEADLASRAQELRRSLALEALLLTRSEEGMTLFTDSGEWSVPAQAREVYDVSGAGDTVIAVLAVMLAAGAPMRDAVLAANRAGGIVVGKLGTSTVSYHELFGDS